MRITDYEDVIAEFIRNKGITRCPTACVSPRQGSVGAADRVALEKHAVARARLQRAKMILSARARRLNRGALARNYHSSNGVKLRQRTSTTEK
jgi:hypothetical protein